MAKPIQGLDSRQQRLANIGVARSEDEIAKRGLANLGQVRATRFKVPPPKIKSFSLTSPVGTVEATWDASEMHDLAHYEINVSTDEGFGNPRVVKLNQNFYVYDGGAPATTYYFRIRSVLVGPVNGPWSATASAKIGTSDTKDITEGAVTAVINESAKDFALGAGYGVGDERVMLTGTMIIDDTASGAAFVHFVYKHDGDGAGATSFFFRVRRTNNAGGTQFLEFAPPASPPSDGDFITASTGTGAEPIEINILDGGAGTGSVTYELLVDGASSVLNLGTFSLLELFTNMAQR